MRQLKRLSTIVMVALFAFGITSCDKKKDYSEQLVGSWYEEVNNGLSSLTLRNDMVAIELSYGATGFSQKRGTYSSDGNELTLTFDGTSNTYKFEINDDKLIIEYPDAKHTFLKLNTNLDLVGNWVVDEASTIVVVKPLKDELLIPGGAIIDGQEVPYSIPTANLNGDFITFALKNYIQNISFTENTMNYNLISRESEAPINLSKTYTKDFMRLIFSGKVMNLDFSCDVIAIQPESVDQTMLVIDKENVCSMILGFTQLLGGSDLSEQELTQEQYDYFKKEFMATFESFAATIYLNRVK